MIFLQRNIAQRVLRFCSGLLAGAVALLCVLAGMKRLLFNPQPERSAGRTFGQPTRRPEAMNMHRDIRRALSLFIVGLSLSIAVSTQAAVPGEDIPNFATLHYDVGGVPEVKDSNTVIVTVRSPAVIEFLKYAPSTPGADPVPVAVTVYDGGGGSFVNIPQPLPSLQPTVPLVGTPIYYLEETLYLRLTDLDQNLDSGLAETILLTVSCAETGDTEILRLIETGPDTGIFSGYLPTVQSIAPAADGQMVVVDECHLEASYTDTFDLIQTVTTDALVDPYGIVFDTATGLPVNGATVTLIDTVTGLPALVYGDDGISIFQPDGSATGSATVITGGTATDESGKNYQMPDGGFRFPYVLPGSYRFEVTPPTGYTAPTLASDAQILVVRPGAALVNGSRGEDFTVNPGPALRIDYPVDPLVDGLWLIKTVSESQASIGDFLQYHLTLQNNSNTATARDVIITDHLPLGFRYQNGSARQAGNKISDPTLNNGGRTMIFPVGDLAPTASIEITYVVEVAAGTQPGASVNQAVATGLAGAVSNWAHASVQIREEFFNNKTFLIGRILQGSCELKDTEMPGLPGVRVYLEDGSYVVTDNNGKYHFEGVEPGVHVVQVDLETLPAEYEMVPCEQTSQFANRTFSQFVDLHGGTLWRVNFYANERPPMTGEVTLQLNSALEKNEATFTTTINASTVDISNLRLTMMLPGQAVLTPGSAQVNGQKIDDPMSIGGAMTLRSPSLEAGQTAEFSIRATLEESDAGKELPVKALLTFDTPIAGNQRTPIAENRLSLSAGESRDEEDIRLYPHFPSFVAELQKTDQAMLDNLIEQIKDKKLARIDVVGHTDNVPISMRSRKIFPDNDALSLARARSVADYLRRALDTPDEVVTIRGLGESMPTSDNNTDSGRALNRRVELSIITQTIESSGQSQVIKGSSEIKRVETLGDSPTGRSSQREKLVIPENPVAPEVTSKWLADLPHETGMIWPQTGYAPVNPSTAIMLEHRKDSQVELLLNGERVPKNNYDTSKPVPNSQFKVSLWHGVDLGRGKNTFEAIISNGDNTESRISHVIWYNSEIETISFLEEDSHLLADGLNPPAIALQLMDKEGNPVRPGMKVEYQVSSPYQAVMPDNTEVENISSATATMTTGPDGKAYAQLEPTTQSGEVTVSLLSDKSLQATTWLKPAPRDWILVGFAEGTVGYNQLSGNQVNLEDAGIDEHYYEEGQVKFFAKGAIKGDWLLTMAYDSDKPNRDGDSLHQIIDPDSYYPLYGDGTQQGYEAASARKLYVKLERDQFYALFGDMDTGLNQTELSQYSRTMNGFKLQNQTDNFSVTMFAADTRQAFAKDEIRGDGTSGRYYLTQQGLVINSESITIETRDRFHSERVLDEVTLSRHTDYEIDYNDGSLFFKRPISSKDAQFNPIFIVVRYETIDSADTNMNYGGRVAAKMLDQKVEVGGTYVHEEKGAGDGNLYGADVTVNVTPETSLHAEMATTETNHYNDKNDGTAFLAEVKHESNRTRGQIYYREQQEGFGLGQQNGSETGTRKYGTEGEYNLSRSVSLSGLAYHEDNTSTGAKRDVAEVKGRYSADRYGLHTGLRGARDQFDNGISQQSTQWLFGGNWVSPDRRLNLRGTYEQSLGNKGESSDYPTLLTLGSDYNLTENVSLFAEQEFSWGEAEDTDGTRAGLRATPWAGGNMTSTIEQQTNENGQRVFALFGLGQSWQASETWSFDASIDRSQTIKHPGNNSVNVNAPAAHGTDNDFTALSVGATKRLEKWTWWNRVETRHADTEDKYGVSTSVVGEPEDGIAVSAKALAFITKSSAGIRRKDGNVRLGLAYRPHISRWIVLNRLDFYFDRESGSSSSYDSWRIVNHLHANFRANRKLQMSFYYGLKYVRDTFDNSTYSGFTDMIAFETRYNLNKRWDIGLHASMLHSWNSGQVDYSLGGDIGYSPMTNAWISLGYNLVGFKDEDFSAANYTAEGAYLRFRAKFDQQSVREAAEWINR